MQIKTEQIKLSEVGDSSLPLGYKKINLDQIPSLEVENKRMLYNRKFRFHTMQVLDSNKPISKILS